MKIDEQEVRKIISDEIDNLMDLPISPKELEDRCKPLFRILREIAKLDKE